MGGGGGERLHCFGGVSFETHCLDIFAQGLWLEILLLAVQFTPSSRFRFVVFVSCRIDGLCDRLLLSTRMTDRWRGLITHVEIVDKSFYVEPYVTSN